jgi:hypothetical protein
MLEKKLNPQKLSEIIEHASLITINLDKKYLPGEVAEL